MGRYKKYIAILLMFSVYMMPFNARAAGMSGWSVSNPVAQGASTAYSAAKNVIINGKNVVKTSTALITPNASQVAKLLGKGVAGVALSVAIQEMLGAVDFVMDPDNNQIKYNSVGKKAVWMVSGKIYEDMTIQQACTAAFSLEKKIFLKYDSSYCYAGYIQDKNETITAKWAYAETTIDVKDDEQKTIPLDAVAQQIISKANSGDKTAQTATTAAAADIVNEAEKDDAKARPIVNQLEANSKTQTEADANTATGTQTQNPTKPNTTDLSLEFPTFCGWAPQVCEAAQVVISFPQTLTNWWETSKQKTDSWAKSISDAYASTKEWFQKEPEKENNELDIENPIQSEPATTINFSTACPAKIPLTFNWNGQTLDFSFDFTIWCESISTFVYPIVVALGSLHALYIVAGVRQDG
ncbi:virulence factor TspB C-terminal domain-related protein [Acinetobacter guillouiae]|uniref:virulence factor TspB C-terminal domain-related protein n=1 Tax=Acinetobacter guillouiae TaxID=106649 RepID=UPI003AF553A1